MELSTLPPCTALYIFDEAFQPELMEHILELINKAPDTLCYILSSKAGRHPEWKHKLEETCPGVELAGGPIPIKKAGSGKGSRFQLFRCTVNKATGPDGNVDIAQYTSYWNNDVHEKITYYESLATGLAMDAEVRKHSRKNRTSQNTRTNTNA